MESHHGEQSVTPSARPGAEVSEEQPDLRVLVAGPPVFSRNVCGLLRDTPWICDIAPLPASPAGGGAADRLTARLSEADVLLIAVPGTAELVSRLTAAMETTILQSTPRGRRPALALLTVGGPIFRSEIALAERLGIRVFLSVRDGADTLRGGVLAAARAEDYCSPDLQSLRQEIAHLVTPPTDASPTPPPPQAASPESSEPTPTGGMATAPARTRKSKPNVPSTARRRTPTGPG